jgi:hypothetical protein
VDHDGQLHGEQSPLWRGGMDRPARRPLETLEPIRRRAERRASRIGSSRCRSLHDRVPSCRVSLGSGEEMST